MRLVPLLVPLVSMACGSTGTTPRADAEAVAIAPVEPLLDWLHARTQADDVVRIPVVVRRDASGIGIGGAGIGVDVERRPTVRLKLDDTRLGISLNTRLRSLCPAPASGCAVWLVGVFGQAMPGANARPGPDDDGRWPFVIHRVGEVVDPTEDPRAARVPTTLDAERPEPLQKGTP